HPQHLVSGMVSGIVSGHYAPDDCSIPIAPLAEAAKAAFVPSAAVAVDAAARSVSLANGETLHYDALSLDIGAAPDRDAVPGAREHALFTRPTQQFTQLWQGLIELAQTRSLSVVVLGAGASAVELAFSLQHRLRERARVSLVTGGAPPLPDSGAGLRERALRTLKARGVTLFTQRCTEITERHVVLASGARLICDAPLAALPGIAPDWLGRSGLALDEHGFVAAGATLQSLSHAAVFVAGDAALLALNLRRYIAGGELQTARRRSTSLELLSCGDRTAIVSWRGWSAQGRCVGWWKERAERRFVRGVSRGV
ncbi:MAG TPA: FAD-dependent oxidoreductase, partial [Albitalea sp.]|nr:FAD-dependent oxidoreductase [Albitalea sp.]